MTCSRLPGGLAMISSPASSGSSASVSFRCARPPPNRRVNSFWKLPLTSSKAASSRSRPSRLRLGDALAQPGDGVDQIDALGLQAGDLLLDLGRLGLGAQIDRAHIVALADQALEQLASIGSRSGSSSPGVEFGDRQRLFRRAFQPFADALRPDALRGFVRPAPRAPSARTRSSRASASRVSAAFSARRRRPARSRPRPDGRPPRAACAVAVVDQVHQLLRCSAISAGRAAGPRSRPRRRSGARQQLSSCRSRRCQRGLQELPLLGDRGQAPAPGLGLALAAGHGCCGVRSAGRAFGQIGCSSLTRPRCAGLQVGQSRTHRRPRRTAASAVSVSADIGAQRRPTISLQSRRARETVAAAALLRRGIEAARAPGRRRVAPPARPSRHCRSAGCRGFGAAAGLAEAGLGLGQRWRSHRQPAPSAARSAGCAGCRRVRRRWSRRPRCVKPSQRHSAPSRVTSRWPWASGRRKATALGLVGHHADLAQAARQRRAARARTATAAQRPRAAAARFPAAAGSRQWTGAPASADAVRSSPSAAPSAAS